MGFGGGGVSGSSFGCAAVYGGVMVEKYKGVMLTCSGSERTEW